MPVSEPPELLEPELELPEPELLLEVELPELLLALEAPELEVLDPLPLELLEPPPLELLELLLPELLAGAEVLAVGLEEPPHPPKDTPKHSNARLSNMESGPREPLSTTGNSTPASTKTVASSF